MSYIALIPEDPLFEGEHMTLVWCGKNLDEQTREVAELVAGMLQLELPCIVTITSHPIFGVSRVAQCVVPAILSKWRDKAVMLGLNRSQFVDWNPHISAPSKELLRPVGSSVQIVKAEFLL